MLIARSKLNFGGPLYECFVHYYYSQLYVLFNNSFVMHYCGRYNDQGNSELSDYRNFAKLSCRN